MKKLFLIVIVLLMLLMTSCTSQNNGNDDINNEDNNNQEENNNQNEDNKQEEGGSVEMKNPIIVITLEDGRTIKLELYPEVAPITVENFLKLVDEEFFDGVCFHRVIEGFMIQTGGYYLDGFTLSDKKDVPSIKGEFEENGVENNLEHTLGVISMARSTDMNSASSQFFICSADAPHLNGKYAAFGKTLDEESNKVVIEISKVNTINIGYGFTDFPETPVVIKTIRRG